MSSVQQMIASCASAVLLGMSVLTFRHHSLSFSEVPRFCSPTERCPIRPSLLQKVLNHFNMKAVKCLQQSLWWNEEDLKKLPPGLLLIHSVHCAFIIFHAFPIQNPLHCFSFTIYYLSSGLYFFNMSSLSFQLFSTLQLFKFLGIKDCGMSI